MAYDSDCYELAEKFLDDDDEGHTDKQTGELAQAIQDAIENWFVGRKSKPPNG